MDANQTFTIENLFQSTPLVKQNFPYQREIGWDEVNEMSQEIAQATIQIEKKSAEIRELTSVIKAINQERSIKASILDSGKIEDVAETALIFYNPQENTCSIYIKKDGEMVLIMTREAWSTEVQEWVKLQNEIKQTEIVNSSYKETLTDFAKN